ncbi:MAG: WbqC family protein [Bacteroidales bacterium]|nr:WbqC family protein [Bacteroidales bacterium]
MILSTAYFPPVAYFSLLASAKTVQMEVCESYRKQTWRNRCRILTSNGPMDLRVPVLHDGGRLITDIRVDWSTPWLRQTEYAIDTAYYSSPFFEYYREDLFALLDRQPERLWDLNMSLIDFFCRKIGISPQIVPTQDWQETLPEDWRDALSPKRPCPLATRPYWQVFREKFGFVDGLSIMDLVFNEGPESLGYLLPER